MAINKLYISTPAYSWNVFHSSELLTNQNCNKVLSLIELKDYHTTIADLTSANTQECIKNANQIILVDLDLNFFKKFDSLDFDFTFGYSYLMYLLYEHRHKVLNFEWVEFFDYKNFNFLTSTRINDNPCLWVAGCSYTYGVGVDPHQTYGSVLAKKLNLNFVNLGRGGASINWAVDQLLRSNIQKNDIVVLGITSLARYEYTDQWQLKSTTCGHPEFLTVPLEYYFGTTHIVLTIKHILEAINFCQRVGAHLYLANIAEISWIPLAFDSHPNYISLIESHSDGKIQFIDLGTDGSHPGPLQHQQWADKLYHFIKQDAAGST